MVKLPFDHNLLKILKKESKDPINKVFRKIDQNYRKTLWMGMNCCLIKIC